MPEDTDGFLELVKGLNKIGKPAGMALGHASGDGNAWVHWVLWSHGGTLVDENDKVTIVSPETEAALEYAKQLYENFIPGTASWNDSFNNKAFLAEEVWLTNNGVSIYAAAKKGGNPPADADEAAKQAAPKMAAIAEDMNHSVWPIGPVGKPTEFHICYPLLGMQYTKYPNAVKAFMQFMMEKENYAPWAAAAVGYLTQSLNAYKDLPFWTEDPKITPARLASERTLTAGYKGSVNEAAAAALADFIVLDMIANYVSGRDDAEGAMKRPSGRPSGSIADPGLIRGGARPPGPAAHPLTEIAPVAEIGLNRARSTPRSSYAWERLMMNRNWLGFWFMMPAAIFLILFLAYPLGYGVWLSLTDARIGRPGEWVGLENYQWLWDDDVFWLSVFNTLLYTIVASTIKFAVGLYLALLLNRHMRFKAIIRAVVLIPFIVPTVLSAIAFWWIFDTQFSILTWMLHKLHFIPQDYQISWLGSANVARACVIFANIWRGVPFVAITLLAGLQTVPGSLYEAATIDGATRWQLFRHVTYPMLTPIIAVVMTFSVLFTFTDFQLIWVLTRGGPFNATHLMATLSYQRAILGGYLGEGAAISTAMIPFLLTAIMFSWFGLQRRKWQHGGTDD